MTSVIPSLMQSQTSIQAAPLQHVNESAIPKAAETPNAVNSSTIMQVDALNETVKALQKQLNQVGATQENHTR